MSYRYIDGRGSFYGGAATLVSFCLLHVYIVTILTHVQCKNFSHTYFINGKIEMHFIFTESH